MSEPPNDQAMPSKSTDTKEPQAIAPVEKLDDAVEFINRKTVLSGLDLAREVGKYILDNFFDGDYESFTNPSSAKEQSFRALLARNDLILGTATLYSFVRVSHQLQLMPPDLVERLTLTQHRTLLPLPDPKRKEELARRALSEGWPSQILAEQVSKLLPKSRRGRKPSPQFVKAIRRVTKELERPFTEELTDDEISRLGPKQTAALIAKIEENLNHLGTLRRTLDERRIRLWPDES